MGIIIKNIKWLMLVSGVLTCSMIFAVFAPQTALISMFGEGLTEPLANVLVRSWAFLIFLMGGLLIYGAYKPEHRILSIVIVSLSKIAFILLILLFGAQYLDKSLVTIIFDSVVVSLFMIYLVSSRLMNGTSHDQ